MNWMILFPWLPFSIIGGPFQILFFVASSDEEEAAGWVSQGLEREALEGFPLVSHKKGLSHEVTVTIKGNRLLRLELTSSRLPVSLQRTLLRLRESSFCALECSCLQKSRLVSSFVQSVLDALYGTSCSSSVSSGRPQLLRHNKSPLAKYFLTH